MRRNALLLAGALLAVAGFATSLSLAAQTAAPTVKSSFNKGLGKTVLVNPAGHTLYRFAPERSQKIKCTGGCAAAWPPLTVAAGSHPLAGTGVTQAKLGTVKRPDGKTQVTYGGWPLYRFGADTKAGDAKGQGLEGLWFAVTVAGAAAPAQPQPPPPPGTTTDTGYNYP